MENSKLTVIVREPNDAFTAVSTAIARDCAVSCRARGLWYTVMTLPPTWDFSIRGLEKILPEGQFAIRSALAELVEAGYVTWKRQPVPGGGSKVEYTFYQSSVRGRTFRDLTSRDLTKQTQSIDSMNLELKEIITESPPSQSPTRKTRQRRAETNLPPDFELTPRMREWAAKNTPSLDIEQAFERFKDTARAKNWMYADWEAHWRNAMRNVVKWNEEAAARNGSTASKTYHGRALGEIR